MKLICLYFIPIMVFSNISGQLKGKNVEGWAIIIEKENYTDVGWSAEHNLVTNYLVSEKWKSLFAYFNWNQDNILNIREDCTRDEIIKALLWLTQKADSDDIVLFYYDGHGKYLREQIKFHEFIEASWAEIKSTRKVVILSCCYAGGIIDKVSKPLNNTIFIGGTGNDEILWKGLWNEDLPIIGSVFTNYFIQSFTDPTADNDKNGFVSIKEASIYTEDKQRYYMQNILWTSERFRNDSLAALKEVPHVIMKDLTNEDTYLDLKYYCK